MLELRRVKAGIFAEPSITLYDFDATLSDFKERDEKRLREILIPGEIIATILPSLRIRKDVLKKCLSGSPIFPSFLEEEDAIAKKIKEGEKICIFCEDRLVGIYNFLGKKDITARPEFVLN